MCLCWLRYWRQTDNCIHTFSHSPTHLTVIQIKAFSQKCLLSVYFRECKMIILFVWFCMRHAQLNNLKSIIMKMLCVCVCIRVTLGENAFWVLGHPDIFLYFVIFNVKIIHDDFKYDVRFAMSDHLKRKKWILNKKLLKMTRIWKCSC